MRILSLTRLSDHYTRYDISVEGVHNFVAEGIVVHNTSANVRFKDGRIGFFAGGTKHTQFVSIFDEATLLQRFKEIGHESIVVHGEAYGGKMHRMSKTYGASLRFVAFDVKVGDVWLQVEQAANLVSKLGLEFVYFERGPATLEWLDAQRDADSVQAIRNGMGAGHKREGIVIRPPIEVRLNNGKRICAKHKRDEFMETRTPREVDPAKQKEFDDAKVVAEEFVVPMRLEHILDKMRAENAFIEEEPSIEDAGNVIKRMIGDIKEEEGKNIVWSKSVEKAIGRETVKVFKDYFKKNIPT